MTDRINSLTVVFDDDIREDDIETLCSAIRCMRRVIAVEKNVNDGDTYVAKERVRHEIAKKLRKVINEVLEK